MGEEDPEEARNNSSNSLRAVYSVDKMNNAFGCAIDLTAVNILFASSPMWSPGELLEFNSEDYSMICSVNTAFLAALHENTSPKENSDAARFVNKNSTLPYLHRICVSESSCQVLWPPTEPLDDTVKPPTSQPRVLSMRRSSTSLGSESGLHPLLLPVHHFRALRLRKECVRPAVH